MKHVCVFKTTALDAITRYVTASVEIITLAKAIPKAEQLVRGKVGSVTIWIEGKVAYTAPAAESGKGMSDHGKNLLIV